MFDYPYLVELLTPGTPDYDKNDAAFTRFAERYRTAIEAGYGVSVPDNPMGRPRIDLLQTLDRCGLEVHPERVVMNLNTFHLKDELDRILGKSAEAKLKYILVVRGDGGPLLPKLDPGSIGGSLSVATSIDLIRYINKQYPDFVTGAAFNPYKKPSFELDRLKKKIDAGARFTVTQPVIGRDPNVDMLRTMETTVVIEAWMSKNIDLLYKSVGKKRDGGAEDYDPVSNLKRLRESYPGWCVYLSMLNFKTDWREMLRLHF